MSNSQKSKWALVPIGVVATVIAAVAAYGQIDGRARADMDNLRTDVNAMTIVLPKILDRLTEMEINQKWILKGMEK